MSCLHGNWPPCELCDEVDAAYARGFKAGQAALAGSQATEVPSDKVCKEPDGCPTELAVLQRYWRAKELQGEGAGPIKCYVAESKESCDAGPKYWVTIERNGKTITPYHTFIRGRAEYEVATWNHLLNGAPEPDILAYDTDEGDSDA